MMAVVISAAGVVSGAGSGRRGFREGLREGRSNRQMLAPEPPITNESLAAIQVIDFDPVATLGKRGLQFLPHVTQILLVAVVEALSEARLEASTDESSLGVVVGTNFAGLRSVALYDWTVIDEGPSFVSPMEAPNTLANAPASHLSIRFKARALNTTVSTGRCASLDAIGYAAEVLHMRTGQAKAILAGGVEEINAHTLWQYKAMGLNARGVIPGEAAALFVLEAADSARVRGVKPLARFGGWSNYLAPLDEPVNTVTNACRLALSHAGVSADDIGLVGLGVNGDEQSDDILAAGVARVFESSAKANEKVLAYTTKGLTGETYAVSGGLQVAAALDALQDGRVPPSLDASRRAWPAPLAFAEQVSAWQPAPVLVVEYDPLAGASAVLLLPWQD